MAQKPLGGLVLHGFTSHISTVEAAGSRLAALGLPYQMPYLRGHGTKAEDLKGLTGEDWYADAAAALDAALAEAERVVIVALSFGCMLALDLAGRHPQRDRIAGLCLASPYYGLKPRSNERLMPLLFAVQKSFAMKAANAYSDPARAARDQSYRIIPSSAAVASFRYVQSVRQPQRLKLVTQPILICAARNDHVVDPAGAQVIYDTVASADKELVWYERSGHEMFLDVEADAVLDRIEAFVRARQGQNAVTA